MGNTFSAADIFQFCLFFAACWGCYFKGKSDGISQIIMDLVDREMLVVPTEEATDPERNSCQ